jgi:hypothetical protein
MRAPSSQPARAALCGEAGPQRDVHRGRAMRGPARGLLAGLAAYKLGGGCLSTILVFILIYWALGYANC